jgi:YHS domain-containing protein
VDPEFALYHLQRALWDPVNPTRLGSLSPDLQSTVNGEIYRFATPATLAAFRAHPVRYCGVLRDPVTGGRFTPTASSPHVDWNGGPYYFASDSTRTLFRKAPKKYEVVREA